MLTIQEYLVSIPGGKKDEFSHRLIESIISNILIPDDVCPHH